MARPSAKAARWLQGHAGPHYDVWAGRQGEGRTQVAAAHLSWRQDHALWDNLFGQSLAVLDGLTVTEALPVLTAAIKQTTPHQPAEHRELPVSRLLERLRYLCSVYAEGGDPGKRLQVTSIDCVGIFDLAAGAIAGKLTPAEALEAYRTDYPGMSDENRRGMLNFAVECVRHHAT